MGVMVVVTVGVLVASCVVAAVCVALIDHQRQALEDASDALKRAVGSRSDTDSR
jgi:Na+-transporting NADH:ubiquinone oxidoreductase subunit NqrC